MLITCPECELQVSDKALSCPHCGYPMTKNKSPRSSRAPKHRRLPNGFGRITELKGRNLRKPFRVLVSVGKDSNGRPIARPLKPEGYFTTYNEAYAALVEYHKNPYDLEPDITVKELYEQWTAKYFQQLKSATSQRTITSAWSYCSQIYSMRVKDIRPRHIKACMEEGTFEYKGELRRPTENIKSRMKSMFNLMLDYAVEYDIVDKNYARTFELGTPVTSTQAHAAFSKEEFLLLTDNDSGNRDSRINRSFFLDLVLIQCYSGWRPQELVQIKVEDVDLENWTFRGGMKTEAGINRIVPIHSSIRTLVENRYEEAQELNSEYLFNCTDTRSDLTMTYDKYRKRFDKAMKHLGTEGHRPHDCRKHFITMAKEAGVDEYAIKRLVGHSISDITESVYTERSIEWLRNEIEKIPGF